MPRRSPYFYELMRAMHSLLATRTCPELTFLNKLNVYVPHLPEFVWDDARTQPRTADVHDFCVYVCEALCVGHCEALVAYVLFESVLVQCGMLLAPRRQARQLWLVCCMLAKKTCNDEEVLAVSDAVDAFEKVNGKQLRAAEANVLKTVGWKISIESAQYALYHRHIAGNMETPHRAPRIFLC